MSLINVVCSMKRAPVLLKCALVLLLDIHLNLKQEAHGFVDMSWFLEIYLSCILIIIYKSHVTNCHFETIMTLKLGCRPIRKAPAHLVEALICHVV